MPERVIHLNLITALTVVVLHYTVENIIFTFLLNFAHLSFCESMESSLTIICGVGGRCDALLIFKS